MLILLAVDGSELSLDAVRHALALRSDGLRASFVLANVQEPTHFYEVLLAPDAEMLEAASDEAGAHALASAQALLKAAGAEYETEVAHGDPAQMLLDIAERHAVDAIMVGTRGAGSLRSALLGSVSQTVLHGATVPVTIIRHLEPESLPDDDIPET